ncbi:PepSY domain-containing protein [Methylobacterium sp. W2]|uniref:PepSY-associated TM helix domain-containing protein n=1 Tax=Methylobacterium sp. W2 TaxID=2598107 RepID=UPI001D0C6A28|nr:PepSY domain-containing protein [Methylobacterium sp. W2]MCC0809388.1 PepSY domain-containing protein [Methylobacterium sp. W2]
MTTSRQGASPAQAAMRVSRDGVYRAVWRWHFYAGLLCLPFLVLLSATGAIYLFKDEINATLFAHRTEVTEQNRLPVSPSRLVYTASEAVPGGVPVSFTGPGSATASAIVTMREGATRIQVYLNPYNGDVLDTVTADTDPMMVVRRLHSLSYFGTVANGIVEVVAGFAIILVVTGTYLWWPRGQGSGTRGGVVTVRARPSKRVWWRDLHAVTGLVAGTGLFFLAITGLPWSVWWGQQVRALSNEAGLGQPRAVWAGKAVSAVPMGDRLTNTGWTMEDAPMPVSQATEAPAIGLDRATAILDGLGMPHGYEVALPVGPTGIYAAAIYPRDVDRQRLISLDQYTGAPLLDVAFADLGGVGQAIQYGIGLHKGEYWGRLNQLAMLAFCLATILLSVTAAVMWWKRRPAGGLGVPPWPRDRRIVATVTALVLGLGALFPLTGLAILAMIGIDLGIQALRRGARRPAAA